MTCITAQSSGKLKMHVLIVLLPPLSRVSKIAQISFYDDQTHFQRNICPKET